VPYLVSANCNKTAADGYAAKAYWNLDAAKLPYLKPASDRGLGTRDFESLLERATERLQADDGSGRYATALASASCCALAFTASMSSLPVPSVGRAST
jgi:hypothetical protein